MPNNKETKVFRSDVWSFNLVLWLSLKLKWMFTGYGMFSLKKYHDGVGAENLAENWKWNVYRRFFSTPEVEVMKLSPALN